MVLDGKLSALIKSGRGILGPNREEFEISVPEPQNQAKTITLIEESIDSLSIMNDAYT